MNKNLINIGLLYFLLFFLNSCKPKSPAISLSKDYQYVSDANGNAIRELTIEQYDSSNNFVGKKYLYKYDTSSGENKLFLFRRNMGYKQNGDSLFLAKGNRYSLTVFTLGFKDTLIFRY